MSYGNETFNARMDAYKAARNDSRYEGRGGSKWKAFRREITEKEARKRWNDGERRQAQLDALRRAEDGGTATNYPAIYSGFMDKGIPEHDIRPRENVFTFNAWKAKGRSVKKGEHGVRVVTFIEQKDKETGEVTGKRPWTTVVFHVSQTEPTSEAEARWRAKREAKANGQAFPSGRTAEQDRSEAHACADAAAAKADADRWIED